MRIYADLLRAHWLPGLVDVSPKQAKTDLKTWISDADFQLHDPVVYPATLSISRGDTLCAAFACEIVRMSMAARESIASITQIPELPKSRAWAMVKWYYAAFYAAHALLRMCGIALVQLENGHVTSIQRVAGLWGQPCSVTSGYHSLRFDPALKGLTLSKMTDDGSHAFLWRTFEDHLHEVSRSLLQMPGSSPERQAFSLRLDDLRGILNAGHSTKGAWLSYVRNRVNYRHEYAVWYPYDGPKGDDLAFVNADQPYPVAESIVLPTRPNDLPIFSFLSACRFIVALCRDSAYEMNRRAVTRVHFHAHGLIQLEKLLASK